MNSLGGRHVAGLVALLVVLSGIVLLASPSATLRQSGPPQEAVKVAGQASVASRPVFLPSIGPSAIPAAHALPVRDSVASNPAAPAGPSAAAAPASPMVRASWTGLGAADNAYLAGAATVAPPDVQVAAGPADVVEMVNLAVSIWTKQHVFVRNESLMTFFGLAGNEFISDPKVQYDAASGRWFATVTDVGTIGSGGAVTPAGRVWLAVSQGSDPSGTWAVFGVPKSATGECLDQPILGVGAATVIVSVNAFSSCLSNSYTYYGAQFWVLNKTQLVAGTETLQSFGPYANTASFHPAQGMGPSAADYMVSANANLASVSTLEFFRIAGAPPSTGVAMSNLSVRTINMPPAAVQPGGNKVLPLDTGDFRVLDAVWSRGNLWLSLTDACTPAGDTQARSCVRLIEVNATTASVVQDFDVGAAGTYYLYPALRMDGRGDLLVVFGASSATEYPSLLAAGRLVGAATGTLDPPIVVMAGTASETLQCSTQAGSCRYGDYFGVGLDPSNASLVWAAGEFGSTAAWRTQIFSGAVKAALTFAYRIVDGGTGYAPPALSYTLDGVARSVALASTPTSFAVDPGTLWSVPVLLTVPNAANASAEVWALNTTAGNPPPGGLANVSFAASFTYFHMYEFDFGFRVSDHVYGAAPVIQLEAWGIRAWVPAGAAYYADAGSTFVYPVQLNRSTANERWVLNGSATGTVTGPSSFTGLYYHQYDVTFDYALAEPYSGPGPAVRYSSFGANTSVAANATVWADAAQPYAYATSLTSNGGSTRIGAGAGASGTVDAAGTVTVTYRLQYLLTVSVEPSGLVRSVTGGGWYDAGTVATVSAAAPNGWEFVGWSGSATGNALTATVPMGGPASVTALFYPGLTLLAGDGGSIAYTIGTASGVVPAGGNLTVYAPLGTIVQLTAQPGSVSEEFVAWGGSAVGSNMTLSVPLNGPMIVSAAFATNTVLVAGLGMGVVALVLVALLVVVLVRRRKHRPPA